MSIGIIQGYRGFIMIGGAVYPAMPGSSVAMPKNYSLPPVIDGSMAYQFVSVEGLQFPVFNMNLLPTKQLLNAINLKTWYERSSDDLAIITGTSGICDGYGGFSVGAAKCASCNIGVSQGEVVRFSSQFWGASAVTRYSINYAATKASMNYLASDLTQAVVAFQHTGYSGTPVADKGLISWDLSWSNNLMPNPALPAAGSTTPDVTPSEINAGMMTARLRLVFQANQAAPQNGDEFTLLMKPTDGNPITIAIKNPLLIDEDSRSIQMPRSLREYNYILKGDTASTSPFTIS